VPDRIILRLCQECAIDPARSVTFCLCTNPIQHYVHVQNDRKNFRSWALLLPHLIKYKMSNFVKFKDSRIWWWHGLVACVSLNQHSCSTLGPLILGWPVDWIEQCFTFPPTQYRLYGRWFLQVKRPNQQYQRTKGTNSTQTNQTYSNQTWTQNTASPLVYNRMDGWLGFNGILSTQVAAISCLRKFKVC